MQQREEALLLTKDVLHKVIAHARDGKPEEICGLLRGRGNYAFEVIPGRNVADDKVNNYDVDPQTLLRQFEFEERGDRMVAIYHSHPISEAYPSATDAWSAHYPEAFYLICSLEDDHAPEVRAFRLLPDYFEVDMDSLRSQVSFYETRPGLFGFYQAAGQPVLPLLKPVAEEIDPPFYVVFQVDERGRVDDYRMVAVRERPVQIRERAEPQVDSYAEQME